MTQLTHKDIYTKFMIEYDKANVTSSYPSLTEYEVATFLDKAYNALLAQKVTGNNMRRAGFEYDTKAISDIQPLVITGSITLRHVEDITIPRIGQSPLVLHLGVSLNLYSGDLPNDFLYAILGYVEDRSTSQAMKAFNGDTISKATYSPVKIIPHEVAEKFFVTKHNLPWIKDPVAFIQDNAVCVLKDPIDVSQNGDNTFLLVYVKTPQKFAKDLNEFSNTASYFDGEGGNIEFELNDTMAEELVSLAIGFALENTESPRLNAKLNMRGLEA